MGGEHETSAQPLLCFGQRRNLHLWFLPWPSVHLSGACLSGVTMQINLSSVSFVHHSGDIKEYMVVDWVANKYAPEGILTEEWLLQSMLMTNDQALSVTADIAQLFNRVKGM